MERQKKKPKIDNRKKFALKDFEIARLRLALLKENLDFRDLYEKVKKDPYSFFNVPMPGETDEAFKIRWDGNESGSFKSRLKSFGITFWCSGAEISDVLKFFDPNQDATAAEYKRGKKYWIDFYLPRMFFDYGINQILTIDDRGEIGTGDWSEIFGMCTCVRKTDIGRRLMDSPPYKRVFEIDLRKRKESLVKEFELILRGIEMVQENIKPEDERFLFYEGIFDDSRTRKETWEELKIWRMRIHSLKTFSSIEKELNIPKQKVKDRFYAAFLKTQGKKYVKDALTKIKTEKLYKGKPFPFCSKCTEYCLGVKFCPPAILSVHKEFSADDKKIEYYSHLHEQHGTKRITSKLIERD
jgi:hypothetical protein